MLRDSTGPDTPSSGDAGDHRATPARSKDVLRNLRREDWQEYVEMVIRADAQQRGAEYIPVPSSTQGDLGLEGFTTDGYGYQAYAPENVGKPAELTRKLANKLKDILKLEEYAEEWTRILGPIKLSKWVLITPRSRDKKILAVAQEHAETIRAAELPFISPDFQAIVHTLDQYNNAIARLGNLVTVRIPLEQADCSAPKLARFERERRADTQRIRNKLGKLSDLSEDDREQLRRDLIRRLVMHEQYLVQLDGIAPAIAQAILEYEGVKRSQLELAGRLDTRPSLERVRGLISEVDHELKVEHQLLPDFARVEIGHGMITGWLLHCALDFKTPRNGHST